MVLQGDPGSPLFISFVLHLVVITMMLPRVPSIIRNRKFPLRYHAGMVFFSSMFTVLKSDAFVRLPPSMCLLLSNLQMMVGVAVQYVLFRKTYSFQQLAGVAIVTVGIAWAGNSIQRAKAQQEAGVLTATAALTGAAEMLGSSLCISLLSTLIKMANSTYGESVEEQMFMQHLLTIPVVFPSNWSKVGPRAAAWWSAQNHWLFLNLAGNVVASFAARKASAAMTARSPSLLMTQLVQTMESFLQLLLTAMLRVPPWPPLGF